MESTSGAQRDRPELARALDYMRPGDTLVVWKLGTTARSLKQLIETVDPLEGKGMTASVPWPELIDTTTAGGKLTFHIFAALAEFERSMIRERTRAARRHPRGPRAHQWTPRFLTDKDLEMARALLANQTSPWDEVASRLSVAPATLYRSCLAVAGGIHASGE